jgi:signal transduction histidine kinase
MQSFDRDPLAEAYHELRTPLGLLSATLGSMADNDNGHVTRRKIDLALRTVDRLMRTSEQVLGLAEASRAGDRVWYSPASVLAQVSRDLGELGATIDLGFDDSAAAVLLFGVVECFETLVQSLLTNAIEHGEEAKAVQVHAKTDGHDIDVTITNAISDRPHRGRGIGLYLCRRFTEQLGGTLTTTVEAATYHVRLRLPVNGTLGQAAASPLSSGSATTPDPLAASPLPVVARWSLHAPDRASTTWHATPV